MLNSGVMMIRMSALETIKFIGVLPMSTERPCTIASNSELRRWFDKQSVVINGIKPKFNDVIEFPVTQLIFFPKSVNKKVTVI